MMCICSLFDAVAVDKCLKLPEVAKVNKVGNPTLATSDWTGKVLVPPRVSDDNTIFTWTLSLSIAALRLFCFRVSLAVSLLLS